MWETYTAGNLCQGIKLGSECRTCKDVGDEVHACDEVEASYLPLWATCVPASWRVSIGRDIDGLSAACCSAVVVRETCIRYQVQQEHKQAVQMSANARTNATRPRLPSQTIGQRLTPLSEPLLGGSSVLAQCLQLPLPLQLLSLMPLLLLQHRLVLLSSSPQSQHLLLLHIVEPTLHVG